MKAKDIKLGEIVRFSEGLVSLHGRRLVIHDMYAIAQLRQDLVEMVGLEQTRRIFTRFGYFWGQADAAAMKRIFQWDNITEWLKAGPKLHMLQGVTKVDLKRFELDDYAEHLIIEVLWHNSIEAEEHLSELGTAKEPSCWTMVGYASGYASFCLDKSVYFIEQKCKIKGDNFCSAIGKDIDSWGPEIKPYLPYFHADNIQGKIRVLTKQIRDQELEIARQRKKLEQALHGPSISSVEVRSRRFQQVLDLVNKVAKFDTSLLITGPTGVGKEVLARHIHGLSPRNKGPFVAVNCTALPETLLENELFGHKAGSFTGAAKDKHGLFEEARGGIIFLDEIGDITPAMQLKLLRVLQEGEIKRIGENRPRKLDVRVIAATNRDLDQMVSQKAFREDLYYRLQVVRVEVPSLCERQEDILPLARHFVKKCSDKLGLPDLQISAKCINFLIDYSWPGNIRELENAIEHAAVLCTDQMIMPEYFPPKITKGLPQSKAVEGPYHSLAEVEREHIKQVLEVTNGNRAETAKILGIGSATLYRKLKLLNEQQDEP